LRKQLSLWNIFDVTQTERAVSLVSEI